MRLFRGCRVLVTSRRSRWSPTLGVTALPLDLLPRQDSIELLRRYRPDLAADDPGLGAIAGKLGDLPLALDLEGRYLRAYSAEVSLDGILINFSPWSDGSWGGLWETRYFGEVHYLEDNMPGLSGSDTIWHMMEKQNSSSPADWSPEVMGHLFGVGFRTLPTAG